MKFQELGLTPETLKAVLECGYETPTPIQEQAIPIIQMGRDIVGLAQTGTGKTAGFTLPMIDALSGGRAKTRMPRSLVLAPTRELAAQVAENFEKYGKYQKLSMALLVGGESMVEQRKLLDKGVDVLIATPGRLLDLFERGAILLNDIKILVIDEADRMLDMGFIPDIEKIVAKLPPFRQTLLFSATMPNEIKGLTKKFLSNPKEVSVAPPSSPAKTVEQFLVHVHPKDKTKTLGKILDHEDIQSAFIFMNRKRDIDGVTRWLKKSGHKVAGLHGDMQQSRRTETLEDFKSDKFTLLVCSDVAARGLDVKDVSHVINYDLPMNSDDYVHRIGRTGRAGQKGRAWSLATRNDEKYLQAIEKLMKREIPVFEFDGSKSESKTSKSSSKPQNKKEEPKKPSRKPSGGSKPRKSKNDNKANDDNTDTTGFGDDMPAFFR